MTSPAAHPLLGTPLLREPFRTESLQHGVLVAGEDFTGKKFAGDQAKGGAGMREVHKAPGDLLEFAEDRPAVSRNGLVAALQAPDPATAIVASDVPELTATLVTRGSVGTPRPAAVPR